MVESKGELSAGLLEAYMARFELTKAQVTEQKQAFDLLDLDGNGKVTFDEIKVMNSKLEQPMSEKDLKGEFVQLDADGDNQVTFQEFLKVYVKGEFGRDVPLHHNDDIAQVHDLVSTPSKRSRLQSSLDPITESVPVMKLSSKKSANYYIRVAKLMLQGSEEKPCVDELEINALGHAIPLATAVAASLEQEKLVKVAAVRTGLQEVPDTERHCPVMRIRVAKATV
eukprot:TRINITY_DN49306_c0_g1_i1.p1 TRINITY_DN49306_c0_g1~~TRINITY_DN49306_c0_g1_i1.p1  ORF type:complete len:225 (+),score=54.09 TRINITY_DN49306_c0_g1_i1:57-731(+)